MEIQKWTYHVLFLSNDQHLSGCLPDGCALAIASTIARTAKADKEGAGLNHTCFGFVEKENG